MKTSHACLSYFVSDHDPYIKARRTKTLFHHVDHNNMSLFCNSYFASNFFDRINVYSCFPLRDKRPHFLYLSLLLKKSNCLLLGIYFSKFILLASHNTYNRRKNYSCVLVQRLKICSNISIQ